MEENPKTPAADGTETTRVVEADPIAEELRKRNRRRNIGIAVAVVVFVAVLTLLFWGLASHPVFTSVLRDISIVVLAFVTVIIGLFLIVLIFQLQSLIVLLRDEVAPILESVNETAGTVRGTTTFVSDAVVSPMISAASYLSAVRQAGRVAFGGSRKKHSTAASTQGVDKGSSKP
jgi:predicted PurR-regulated permease PerM